MDDFHDCSVCSGDTFVFYRLKRLATTAYRCKACGFTFIDPPLRGTDDDYEAHYESPAYLERMQSDEAKFRLHLKHIDAKVDLSRSPNPRLLEIGSSFGILLKLLHDRGHETEGLELLRAGVAASRQKGLKIHATTLENFSADGTFGTVLSTHVVEHLRDIHLYFRKMTEFLEPEGYGVILTPNGNSVLFHLLRQFWAGATPDEHNLFLTPRAVKVLADAYGYDVVSLSNTGRFWSTSRGILSEGYRMLRSWRERARDKRGAPAPAASGAPRGLSGRDRVFRLIGAAENPFLKLIHGLLSPFLLSDELLIVLRKKSSKNVT